MVKLHAARIIDLHATMMEIIVAEARETRVYLQYVHHKEGRMPSEQYFRIPVFKCQNIMAGEKNVCTPSYSSHIIDAKRVMHDAFVQHGTAMLDLCIIACMVGLVAKNKAGLCVPSKLTKLAIH